MTMQPVEKSTLLDLLKEKGVEVEEESSDEVLKERQKESRKFKGIDINLLKEERRRLIREKEGEKNRARIREIEVELKRREGPDLLTRQTRQITGAIRTELAKPTAPIAVRKERPERVKQTGEQIEAFFEEESTLLTAEEDSQQAPQQDSGQLGVSLEDMSTTGFAQGIGLYGAFGDGQSPAQFTPYPSPVTIQGGLSILGTLQDGQGVTGFRVQWGGEVIDWYPDESKSGFMSTL